MVFQNDKYTGKSKILRITWLIIVVSLCVTIAIAETVLSDFGYLKPVSWLYKSISILTILSIYTTISYNRYLQKYCFIYFTDEDNKNLVFRFYHIKSFGKKYATYKIPIPNFYKFEINTQGKKNELYLFQKTENNKIAKYPPISVTALSKNELKELSEALLKYVQIN